MSFAGTEETIHEIHEMALIIFRAVSCGLVDRSGTSRYDLRS
jgi:hypothetical protein